MNPISAKLKIYTYSSTVLALICILLRLLCLLFTYDTELHYFSYSSALSPIANGILICSLLWAVSSFLFIPRGTLRRSPAAYSIPSVFASALCGFFFIYYGIITALPLLNHSFVPVTFDTYRRDTIVAAIIAISAFLSAIYFFGAFFSTQLTSAWRVFGGFFPVIWAIVSLAQVYFDFTHAMNEPIKVSLQLAMIAAALFFLQEVRILLGRAQPRAAWFSGATALLFCGIGGVSCVAALAAAPLAVADHIRLCVITAAIWLYILFRHYDMLRTQLTPAVPDRSEEEEEK